MNGLLRALASGAAGSAALTALHEVGRARMADAPRMDVYGKRALKQLGVLRRGRDLEQLALEGDLALNAAFYALAAAGLPRRAPWRGLALGAAAGLGALVLGPRLGLGRRPARRTGTTAALTIAWYALGGLAAGVLARGLAPRESWRTPPPGARRAARWEPFPAW